MKRRVVQIELEPAEYSALAAIAKRKGLMIKEALREAALRWTREESGINPNDPIFHVKARDWGKGTENASKQVDETLYGLEPTSLRKTRNMSREAKVNLALDMSSAVAAVILDSIRDQYPRISEARLFELARKRFRSRTTSQQHLEDIRAILANTRVNKRKILDRARKESTVNIFREILQPAQIQKQSNRAVRLER
jgi:hypothetical protein